MTGMRRWAGCLVVVLIALLHGAPARLSAQDRPLQADSLVRLMLDLEGAIASGRVEDFRAIASPAISDDVINRFVGAARGGDGARAIVRERTRRPNGRAYDIVVDVLVSRQSLGRIATWQVVAVPDEAAPGQYKIDDVRELAAVDGLLRLRLDTDRQFAVKDLVVNAPDLMLRMSSGTAFVAESPNGITALVLRGRGEVRFTPQDPAEQLQVQIFGGRPDFAGSIDAAFIRINPAEFVLRVSEKSLVPMKLDPAEAGRATQLFDDLSPRTYNIDLRSLTPERWSLEPTYGSVVVEFRAGRYGWLTYARSPGDHEDISFFDRDDQHNIAMYASEEKRARRGRFYSEDDGAPFDIEHHRLNLAFDPARLWVSGRAAMQVRVTAASLSSLTIKLAQPLAVASVSSPGLGDLLALRIVGQNSLLVGLPVLLQRGDQLTLEVVYGGRLEPQPLDREAMAPQAQGQRSVDPELVMLTPEPRYLYSSRVAWYPQGSNTDYATAEMRITVPSEYQAVASGTLLRSTVVPNENPGRSGAKSLRVLDYVADRPARYVSCLISRFVPIGRARVDVAAVSPPVLARAGATADSTGINVEVLSTSRVTGRNRQTPARVAGMLRFFANAIGEAPYPDFTLAALDDNLPGGHSPPFFVVFHQPLPTTPYSWAADPVAFDDVYPHFFMAHEVAHQWWGQAIGWKTYHEQWLSEGLSQYFAALYAADDRGPAVLNSLISGMRTSAEPFLGQGPISLGYRLGHIKNDGRVFRAIVYNKASVVLHMLRRLIGDEAFFAGTRKFYADWRFRKAGTEDLQAAFEAGGGLKLDRFFEQWVRGFSRPRLRLSWQNSGNGQAAVIRLEQVGEVFDFPLTVSVQYADGRTEERQLKVRDRLTEERLSGAIRRAAIRDPLTFYETAR